MRLFILPALLAATPVVAQVPAADPTCANVRIALPSELAGWSAQTPVSAGLKAGDGATVEVGHAALVSLHAAKHLEFTVKPGTPEGANGGTLALAVTQPGTYRLALGDAAWVDLVRDGKPVASRAHAHGPRCSGIRKIVDFALAPGNYTIQLSGSPGDSLALLVARLG